jgi:hypothetical protein
MWQSVVATLLGNFVYAQLVIFFMAALTYWFTNKFTNVNEPRVAAFSLAIGYAMAKFSFRVVIGDEGMDLVDAMKLGGGLGAIVGLWILWWWLFRRAAKSPE